MSQPRATFAVLLVLVGSACGDEIGDECTLSSDCSSDGDRFCDTNSPGGYCTIIGCDFDTCPEESVCVRFFSVATSNQDCVQASEDNPLAAVPTDDCTDDEACTLSGYCVPRTAEIRFCMRTCGGDGDCRGGYECRNQALMMAHGGEPVGPPGEAPSEEPQRFCAAEPP